MTPEAHCAWFTDYLRQDEKWLCTDGSVIPIGDLTAEQRRDALRWLRGNAEHFHASWLEAMRLEPRPPLHADQLRQAAAILEHKHRNPEAWLESTPLVRRLVALERRFFGLSRRWWR